MKNTNSHLDEDQVIRSVVDETDLSPSVRDHLSRCHMCQEKKQRIEQELGRLGIMAKECAPLPRAAISLAFPEARHLWSWGPVFATACAVILLISGLWWSGLFTTSQEKMMAEISISDDSAPPDFYPDISEESSSGYFEEFLEFVAPLEENQDTV